MSINLRVLVVDDMKSSCLMLARMLTRLGVHHVETLLSGDAAVSYLKVAKADLIISDYHMPGLDGLGLLRHIRETPAIHHTEFVLATGQDSLAVREACGSLKAAKLLIKPLRMDDLNECLENAHRKITNRMPQSALPKKQSSARETLDRLLHGTGIGALV